MHSGFFRRSLFLMVLLVQTACNPAGQHDPEYAIAREMDRYVADGMVAGVVTMVVKDGQIVHEHAAGFRDIESADTLKVSDLFRIASQTKAVTSVAAMMLVEEGKLALDEPLSRFIPEFANTQVAEINDASGGGYQLVPMDRQITIRHLLTHTSGISYGFGPAQQAFSEAGILGWYLAGRAEDIQETARKIARLPLTAQPGSEWVYGYSIDVLGAVIEIASGQPLDRFFQERIFDRLGMNDTHFFIPESKADRLVTVYGLVDDELQRMPDGSVMQSQGEYVTGPRVCFSGGAGLVSTAHDYVRFQLMLLNGGALDGQRILLATSVDEMTTDQVGALFEGNRAGFGFAFRIEGENPDGPSPPGAYSAGGAYHSRYWIDPANNLVGIILTQLIPAAGNNIHKRFKELVYKVEIG